MGSWLSAPLPQNKETPAILNFILQEMFRKADLADIYSLADPERCKRYIIVGEKALDELFLKVNLYPEKGEDGKLYFQSLDGFKSSMPVALREKQTAYCKELSFFFVRIFQTFGALYLSIYDSRIPLSDPVEEVKVPGPYGQVPFQNPGNFYGYDLQRKQEEAPWYSKLGLRGGALTKDRTAYYIPEENAFHILNPYLFSPRSSHPGRLTFESIEALSINEDEMYDKTGAIKFRGLAKPDFTLLVNYYFNRADKENIKITALVNIKRSETGIYTMRFSKFKGETNWPPGAPTGTSDSFFIENRVQKSDRYSSTQYVDTETGKVVPQIIKDAFEKAILKVLGAPEVTVISFLKKFRYISTNYTQSPNILGTHAYIREGQDYSPTVDIVYRTKIPIEKENGRKDEKTINISAKLSITRARASRNSNIIPDDTFRLELNFNDTRVNPSEYESVLDYPSSKIASRDFTSEGGRAPVSDTVNNRTIPEYIEYVFKGIIGHPDVTKSDAKGFQRTREGLIKPYNSERITPGFKVKELWSAMAKDPPVKSYCIARAVQLLSVSAINNHFSKQAFTSVCKLSFPYQKDGSLPAPGKPIIQTSGIYALTLLFFDTLRGGDTQILDKEEYGEYRKYLKYLFESKQGENADTNIPRSVGDIKQTPLSMCKGRDQLLPVSEPLARDLRTVTDQLIQQQRDHFTKAITLIFRLFDQASIERDRKLKFSNAIMRGGMSEVENVASSARELLKDYYRGCETTYREGLKMIYADPTLNPPVSTGR